jgi:nucleoside-triphosphatase THEP1
MKAGQLLVVDEIGKMELGSAAFRDTIVEALQGRTRFLGTILQAGHPWADDLKRDRRVQVLPVIRNRWDAVRQQVLAWVNALPDLRPKPIGTKGKLLKALMKEKAMEREL